MGLSRDFSLGPRSSTVYEMKKLKSGQGPTTDSRAIDNKIMYNTTNKNHGDNRTRGLVNEEHILQAKTAIVLGTVVIASTKKLNTLGKTQTISSK
jgi:hypothetical protein